MYCVCSAGGPVVACAPLVVSENITLKQFGINQVTISQGSPFEDTVITTTGSRTTVSQVNDPQKQQ